MRAIILFLGVVRISSVCGGVIKDQEDPSIEAVVAGNNLEEHNVLLTDEELQIVALLERIQTRFETLDDAEKAQFVKKISTRREKLISTLDKVETIPGTYKLDVPYLRANLEVPEATVEDARSYEAIISSEDASHLERSAAANTYGRFAEDSAPGKTLEDVYEVVTILKQLIMVQIVQQQKQEEEQQQMLMSYAGMFSNSPRSVRPSYQHLLRGGNQRRVRPSQLGHVQQVVYGQGQGYPGFMNLNHSPAESDNHIPLNMRHRRSVDAEENEDDHLSNKADTEEDEEALDVAQASYEDWYNAWYINTYKEWYEEELKVATANFWEESEEESSTSDETSYTLYSGMGDLVEPMQDGMEEVQKLLEPLNEEIIKLLNPLDEQLRELGRYHGLDLSEGFN